MLYFIADLHFGETKDRLNNMLFRQFDSVNEHDNLIINNYNKIIKPKDNVIFVGDICYNNDKLDLINKLNGKKHLILGNHDDLDQEKYEEYFITVQHDTEITKNGLNLYINHYPSLAKIDKWNICGHVHNSWRFQKNTINVGVDCWQFKPVSIEQIKKLMEAIEKHYDKDVWAYKLPANKMHEYRGKESSYANKIYNNLKE